MEKKIKKEVVKKEKIKTSKIILTSEDKQKEIKKLLAEYKLLAKVSFGRGRQIRRRLRRLGYYLSKI
jgi:hypothetical protein